MERQTQLKVVHRAEDRGHVNFGWLRSAHSFSFGGWYNPERMGFGALRVLNDDQVDGGQGFGAHPHRDMEIVSIPLEGALAHEDSIGTRGVIQTGDVQIMSAGTGIVHSEMNGSQNQPVHFLQIWVIPEREGVAPRYEQKTFNPAEFAGAVRYVVAPQNFATDPAANAESLGAVGMLQTSWFARTTLAAGEEIEYALHAPEHGVYLFAIDADLGAPLQIEGEELGRRDAIGLAGEPRYRVRNAGQAPAELLWIEVPPV